MKGWRITLAEFGRTRKDAFGGQSGFLADGRWHTHGRYLDYAAESLSLAILERLVHYKRFDALRPHSLFIVEVPDPEITRLKSLPRGWDAPEPLARARALGDAWCDAGESPALLVPSAVTPGEHNLMINSRHPKWQWDWVASGPTPFSFDARLAELAKTARS